MSDKAACGVIVKKGSKMPCMSIIVLASSSTFEPFVMVELLTVAASSVA